MVVASWCLMLLSGLGQAVIGITSSAFSCRAICCRRSNRVFGTVMYAPMNEQEVTLHNNEQQQFLAGATSSKLKIKITIQIKIVFNCKLSGYPPSYQEVNLPAEVHKY